MFTFFPNNLLIYSHRLDNLLNIKILRCFIMITVKRIQWNKMYSNIDICNYFPNIKVYHMTCKNHFKLILDPVSNYLFKAYNQNPRKRCKVCSELIPGWRQSRRSGLFIVNFKHYNVPCSSCFYCWPWIGKTLLDELFSFSCQDRWTSIRELNRILCGVAIWRKRKIELFEMLYTTLGPNVWSQSRWRFIVVSNGQKLIFMVPAAVTAVFSLINQATTSI